MKREVKAIFAVQQPKYLQSYYWIRASSGCGNSKWKAMPYRIILEVPWSGQSSCLNLVED
jgi:hypothetical protein